MVRDDEMNRLIRYAQGMGATVRFKPQPTKNVGEAEWTFDGENVEITIFYRPRDSKLHKILCLIHEIGHHISFVTRGRKIAQKDYTEALDNEKSQSLRQRIHDYEVQDSQHWEKIYKDTDCKFGIDVLRRSRSVDLWVYRVWLRTGRFPTERQKRAKIKQLKAKKP